MIHTVTANPALDLTYAVGRISIGQTHRVELTGARAGGKGINVAAVLHQVGHPVCAHGAVGGVVGEQVRADLRERGIHHRLTTARAATRRTVAVVENGGAATVFNEQGSADVAAWEGVLAGLDAALRDEADQRGPVVAAGSLPDGLSCDAYAEVVSVAHRHGRLCLVDAAGAALLAAVEAGADVVKPNQAELAEATGADDPWEGARDLCRRGAGRVVVSRGPDGVVTVTPDGEASAVRLRKPLSGNATGAGDAAAGAIVAGLSTGRPWAEIEREAVAWSAAAVLAPVAGELALDHLAALRADLVEES